MKGQERGQRTAVTDGRKKTMITDTGARKEDDRAADHHTKVGHHMETGHHTKGDNRTDKVRETHQEIENKTQENGNTSKVQGTGQRAGTQKDMTGTHRHKDTTATTKGDKEMQ